MKRMDIPYCGEMEGKTAAEAHEQLLSAGASIRIESVNWPDTFSACPETQVHAAHTVDTLYLRYDVCGQQLRATVGEDQGPVWCDSCVEFFCQAEGEEGYMNFETNCIGRMVASRRKSRTEDVRPLSAEDMATISRYSSAGDTPFGERDGEQRWSACIAIPLRLIRTEITFPMRLRGNFYKCADESKQPHYVSWNPIQTEKPDFHCPAFFGEIVLVNL